MSLDPSCSGGSPGVGLCLAQVERLSGVPEVRRGWHDTAATAPAASMPPHGAHPARACRTARSQAAMRAAASSRDIAGSKRRSSAHCAAIWSRLA